MASAGHRVVAIGLGAPTERRVVRRGDVIVVRLAVGRYRGGSIVRYVAAYARFAIWASAILWRRHAKRRLQVIQTNNLPNMMGYVAVPFRVQGVRWLHDIHDPEPELFKSRFGAGAIGLFGAAVLQIIEFSIGAMADVVIFAFVPSRGQRERLGTARRKVAYVPNLPDDQFFPRGEPRRPGSRLAVFHGTVTPRIALDVVIRAIARLKDRGISVRLEIIGIGDAVPTLRALIEALHVEDLVECSGKLLPLDGIAETIRRADVGIAPLWRDAFIDCALPTKLLEYVRLGVPAVATDTPAIRRCFPPDTIGLVPDGDVEGWCRALRRAIDEPVAVEMARRAQRLPVARAWQDIAPQYVKLVAGGPFEAVDLESGVS